MHVASYLEYSKFTYIKMRFKNKFMCVHTCCELGGKFSWEVQTGL